MRAAVMLKRIARQSYLLDAGAVFIVGFLVSGGILAMLLAIPFFAIGTHHKRKLEEIRARQKVAITEETRAAIEALRQEFAALRDTTTEYDISFDTALHRLESRTVNLEQRMQGIEQEAERVQIPRA